MIWVGFFKLVSMRIVFRAGGVQPVGALAD